MKPFNYLIKNIMVKFATVVVSLLVGMIFVMAPSQSVAGQAKKVMMEKQKVGDMGIKNIKDIKNIKGIKNIKDIKNVKDLNVKSKGLELKGLLGDDIDDLLEL